MTDDELESEHKALLDQNKTLLKQQLADNLTFFGSNQQEILLNDLSLNMTDERLQHLDPDAQVVVNMAPNRSSIIATAVTIVNATPDSEGFILVDTSPLGIEHRGIEKVDSKTGLFEKFLDDPTPGWVTPASDQKPN